MKTADLARKAIKMAWMDGLSPETEKIISGTDREVLTYFARNKRRYASQMQTVIEDEYHMREGVVTLPKPIENLYMKMERAIHETTKY